MLASGCLHRDKENQPRLCRCRDTSSAVTMRTFRLGASIGMSTEVPDGHNNKNLTLDRDLDRDIRRTSSPTRFWENNSGISGRCCVGESMYLVCRRDLSTPFSCVFSGALQAERSLSVSRLKGRTTLAGWRGILCLVTHLDFILILVENSPLVLCQFLPLTVFVLSRNHDSITYEHPKR